MTTDMSTVIVPKSDQINAEDFLAGPKTYTIEAVHIVPGTEQPVNIKLSGEPRAWRPCKSMSRVLVSAWGADAKVYPGRSVTLYRDPKVKWGGLEVGGIRVSHLSHIERDMVIQLTATKGKRAPHKVQPLAAAVVNHPAADASAKSPAEKWADGFIDAVKAATDAEAIAALKAKHEGKLTDLQAKFPDLRAEVDRVVAECEAFLAGLFDAPADPADEELGW